MCAQLPLHDRPAAMHCCAGCAKAPSGWQEPHKLRQHLDGMLQGVWMAITPTTSDWPPHHWQSVPVNILCRQASSGPCTRPAAPSDCCMQLVRLQAPAAGCSSCGLLCCLEKIHVPHATQDAAEQLAVAMYMPCAVYTCWHKAGARHGADMHRTGAQHQAVQRQDSPPGRWPSRLDQTMLRP